MSQHTPGPWVLSEESPKIIKKGDRLIGSTCGHPGSWAYPTEEEGIANARLISAAPDLLKQLRELLAMVGRQWDFNDDGDGDCTKRSG